MEANQFWIMRYLLFLSRVIGTTSPRVILAEAVIPAELVGTALNRVSCIRLIHQTSGADFVFRDLRSDIFLSVHNLLFYYLTYTFLPLLIYRPLIVGLLLSFIPLRVYQASVSVLTVTDGMAVVSSPNDRT